MLPIIKPCSHTDSIRIMGFQKHISKRRTTRKVIKVKKSEGQLLRVSSSIYVILIKKRIQLFKSSLLVDSLCHPNSYNKSHTTFVLYLHRDALLIFFYRP